MHILFKLEWNHPENAHLSRIGIESTLSFESALGRVCIGEYLKQAVFSEQLVKASSVNWLKPTDSELLDNSLCIHWLMEIG